jgi:hypothetical protein
MTRLHLPFTSCALAKQLELVFHEQRSVTLAVP